MLCCCAFCCGCVAAVAAVAMAAVCDNGWCGQPWQGRGLLCCCACCCTCAAVVVVAITAAVGGSGWCGMLRCDAAKVKIAAYVSPQSSSCKRTPAPHQPTVLSCSPLASTTYRHGRVVQDKCTWINAPRTPPLHYSLHLMRHALHSTTHLGRHVLLTATERLAAFCSLRQSEVCYPCVALGVE